MNVADAATVPDVHRRMGGHEASARFVRDAHAIVRDMLVPYMLRYWTDFVVTLSIM